MDLYAPVAHQHLLNGTVDLNETTITEIKVGDTALRGRKWLYIHNASDTRIYVGSETQEGTVVTALSLAKRGQKIVQGDAIWLPVSEHITIYGLAYTGGGKRLRIMELA